VAFIEQATNLAHDISCLFDAASDADDFTIGEIRSEIEGALP
jgi:hypothetical protein